MEKGCELRRSVSRGRESAEREGKEGLRVEKECE